MLLGMGYSGTRTAYAVLLAGIAFFILFNIDKPPVRKFGVFMFVVFLAIMLGPFSGNNTVRRFRSTFMGEKDESYRVRLVERAFIRPYIHHHPIGGGMGTTGFNGAVEHPGNPLANFQPDGAYVMRAAETGWIGLLINCTLYFFILKTGIQAFFRIKDPRIKVYYAAGVSCIFAFYVGDYAQLAVGSPADVGIYFGFIAMILKQKHYDKIYAEVARRHKSISLYLLPMRDSCLPPPPSPTAQPSDRKHGIWKVIPCEYRCWYIRDDSTLWAYNNASSFPVQFPIGGAKAITGAGGFNYFRVIDNHGFLWTSLINYTTNTVSHRKRYDEKTLRR